MITRTAKPADDTAERDRLIAEIERYLRVVEAYRRQGCEPRWLPESGPAPGS